MINFIQQMFGSNLLEVTAVVFGLLCVGFTIIRSIHSYTFGIPMAIMYFFIFWEYTLYSDALLQVFFVVIQLYGWYIWKNNMDVNNKVNVTHISLKEFTIPLLITICFWVGLATGMDHLTDSTNPVWDSFIAAASVLAQYLLSRRYIESWLVWMVVDIAAIPLFFIKGLAPTSALYFVFLLMTFKGYYDWRNSND